MIQQPFHLIIVFLGIIAFSLWLSSRFKIASKISPVLIILGLSAILSNTGTITTESAFYEKLSNYAVSFAVCLILFTVRLADLKKAGMPMLIAFAIASFCSVAGCLVGAMLLIKQFDTALAGQGWKIAGPYIGTYIGGSLNFFALWDGLKINNNDLFAAANAVDNLTLVPIFMFWMIVPKFLEKFYPAPKLLSPADSANNMINKSLVPLIIKDIAALSFYALSIMFLSKYVKTLFDFDWVHSIPTILILTTIALIAGRFKFIQNLKGSHELGNFAFYFFFAAVGALMHIEKALRLAPVLFVFVSIVMIIQISLALLLGKIFRINLRVLAVAELAAKAGPSTVIAYTNTKNWNELALPGAAVGLLGYAIGNYIGFAGAYLLKIIVQ
ncbi:MAG: hypothetical protein A2Y10_17855 [Planctomycetes bacterium GWF2_41_51]|nr:MAG: hypothetical protein A2Y10_17855 [Planctomycetes bacterium GWF2_41_51]HBG25883.1 hypothetical protein [Phycisphaerales bacterium]